MDFYEVYEEYYDRVKKFILASVKNPWVADDLIQETFFRIFQNLPQLRDQSKLSSWVFRIAANLCQDYFRSAKRSPVSWEDPPPGEAPGECSPELQVERYQLSLWVQDLVKGLPEPLRQVIILCDIKQETYQEAAALLGISLENVKVRLHRARKRLKALMAAQAHLPQDSPLPASGPPGLETE
jgi:RNA polymerase sigma-70 factor (ECF subfamily)